DGTIDTIAGRGVVLSNSDANGDGAADLLQDGDGGRAIDAAFDIVGAPALDPLGGGFLLMGAGRVRRIFDDGGGGGDPIVETLVAVHPAGPGVLARAVLYS